MHIIFKKNTFLIKCYNNNTMILQTVLTIFYFTKMSAACFNMPAHRYVVILVPYITNLQLLLSILYMLKSCSFCKSFLFAVK